MARTLYEWIGKTDETPVPPRVRLRVLQHFGRRCDHVNDGCGRDIRPGDAWSCDHIEAINGGPNRESNLHPLCEWCNPPKTGAGHCRPLSFP
jgi:5-methylcytosine-specific restriction enzyme A